MFCLHVANRTENLLRHLVEVIRVDRQPVFAPELFLIQSQGMERLVSQWLAGELTAFCHYRYYLPLDFLSHIAHRLGMVISPEGFGRKVLTWRLESQLRDLAGEWSRPLRHYLLGGDQPVKRYQLARRLANLFDQYQILRPEMLDRWEGAAVPGSSAEAWQMELWRRLLAEQGDACHRGRLLRQVIDRLNGGSGLAGVLPKRVSIIGLHTMPPIFIDYLDSLARHMDVHLFLLSPCRKYWGDVESPRQRLRRQGYSAQVEETDEHHPLLAALGCQGRDFQNLLLERARISLEFSSYDQPLSAEDYLQATLLQRVQSDLLENRLPEAAAVPPMGRGRSVTDHSLRVVSCHSRLREIAVLHDHLLDLLSRDSSLELADIIVMAPDIQEYAQLIPALFGDIGHTIADRPLRRRNPVISAFLAFLELYSGRYGWSDLLELLRREAVFPQFALVASEVEQLREWVVASGIRWGLSREQRREDGLADFAETSWQDGLARMLFGYAVDSEEEVEGVFPFFASEGRAAQPLGGLCRFLEVIEQGRRDFAGEQPLAVWGSLLLAYAQELFGSGEGREMGELYALLAQLGETLAPFHQAPVAFPVLRAWFTQAVEESRSSSGFLRGQLTFCSMLPMRSIPARVICLLGLNLGVFPRNDRHDTFDLLAATPRPGDRSGRDDHRYQFLEALLAARSHLYLSYIGQSIRTNAEIPPSVVLAEFLELLEKVYQSADLVQRQPLHPFSPRYFRGGSELFSFSRHACAVARRLRQPLPLLRPWWLGELAEGEKEVRFADLLALYANPQRFFFRSSLDLWLIGEEETPEGREPFHAGPLDRYLVLDEWLTQPSKGVEVLARLQAAGRWPLGSSGAVAVARLQQQLRPFLARVAVERRQLGDPCPEFPFVLQVGDYRLVGTLTGLHRHGVLRLRGGSLRGQDIMAGYIHHLVARELGLPDRVRLVARDRIVGFQSSATPLPTLPGLGELLVWYSRGCRHPLPLLVEPALKYALAGKEPLASARSAFLDSLAKGYQPEWALLYGAAGETMPWQEFDHLCRQLFSPILEAADVA